MSGLSIDWKVYGRVGTEQGEGTPYEARLNECFKERNPLRPEGRVHFSSASANASSESGRSTLRRRPLCTWPSCWAAWEIQLKSIVPASVFNSAAMSLLRTNSGVPEVRDSRSRSKECTAASSWSVFSLPSAPERYVSVVRKRSE